jgi:hypothetical protein
VDRGTERELVEVRGRLGRHDPLGDEPLDERAAVALPLPLRGALGARARQETELAAQRDVAPRQKPASVARSWVFAVASAIAG